MWQETYSNRSCYPMVSNSSDSSSQTPITTRITLNLKFDHSVLASSTSTHSYIAFIMSPFSIVIVSAVGALDTSSSARSLPQTPE